MNTKVGRPGCVRVAHLYLRRRSTSTRLDGYGINMFVPRTLSPGRYQEKLGTLRLGRLSSLRKFLTVEISTNLYDNML